MRNAPLKTIETAILWSSLVVTVALTAAAQPGSLDAAGGAAPANPNWPGATLAKRGGLKPADFRDAKLGRAIPVAAGEVLVKLPRTAQAGAWQRLTAKKGLSALSRQQAQLDKIGYARLRIPEGMAMEDLLSILRSDPEVEAAHPNVILHSCAVATPEAVCPYPWNWRAVHVPEAQVVTRGRSDVVVAVIDSGVDLDHRDLAGRLAAGWNFLDESAPPEDDFGHGTQVAGIIAAHGTADAGVAGIAPGCRVMPLKVIDATGLATAADVAEAILYAVERGCRVINLSLGTYAPSDVLQAGVEYALARNCVVVAAAGNHASDTACYPAAYPGVVAVAAVGGDSRPCPFSNRGLFVDVTAPGTGIRTTDLHGGSTYVSGTSPAAAHVSALAALLLSRDPGLPNAAVHALICDTAKDLGLPGWDAVTGQGLVDCEAALRSGLAPGQDLGLVSLDSLPRSPRVGQSVQIRALIRNHGAIAAGPGVVVARYAGSIVWQTDLQPLAPKEAQEISFPWLPPANPGHPVLTLELEVVPLGGEFRLGDNRKSLRIPLAAAELHDVALKASVASSPPIAAGSPVLVRVEIENLGNTDEPKVLLKCEYKGSAFAADQSLDVPRGASRSVTVVWPGIGGSAAADALAMIHYLRFSAQGEGADRDPANNETVLRLSYDPKQGALMPFHQSTMAGQVHQWLALQGYKYFADQIEGSELGTYLVMYGMTPESPWEQLAFVGSHDYWNNNEGVIEGTYDEDTSDHPSGGGFLYNEEPTADHFCIGADDDELTTGLSLGSATSRHDAALTRAEWYWTSFIDDHYARNEKAKAYYYLGHALHLLEDMTVPAHVHNDMHPSKEPYEDWVGKNGAFSLWSYRYPAISGLCNVHGTWYDTYDWDYPLSCFESLRELFYRTANYTEDYDSDDDDGDWNNGVRPAYTPPDMPSEHCRLSHNPQNVQSAEAIYDDLGMCEIMTMANDLMPYAIRRVADMYRTFYRHVDGNSPPAVWMTDNPSRWFGAGPVQINAAAEDKESGIVKRGYRFQWRWQPNAATDPTPWAYVNPDPRTRLPLGTIEPPSTTNSVWVTFTNGSGLYSFRAQAENGGGVRAWSEVTSMEVCVPLVVSTAIWAGDGTDGELVRVTWGPVAGAGLYQVLRDGVPVGETASNGWSDFPGNPRSHTYAIKAKTTAGCDWGPLSSASDQGWARTAPEVSTRPATDIVPTAATLQGTVHPGNLPASAWFEWGPTTEYGQQTLATNLGPSGVPVSLSPRLAHLEPFSTHHFRLVATNEVGRTYGSDQTFQTVTTVAGCAISSNVVGYVRLALPAGGRQSLLANPFNRAYNDLNTILALKETEAGTQVFRWDVGTQAFTISEWMGEAAGWLPDAVVNPGEGFFLRPLASGANLNATFVGEVAQGHLVKALPSYPLFSYGASLVPQARSLGANGQVGTLQFPAEDGDQVSLWNVAGQTWDVYQYGGGAWDPAEPVIPPGRGFMVQKGGDSVQTSWIRDFVVPGVRSGPRLEIALEANGDVRISWSGTGWNLQQADDPAGPYLVVPGTATSPFSVPEAQLASNKFYRLGQLTLAWPNITNYTDADQCAKSRVEFAVASDCPGVPVTCDPTNGSSFPKGVTEVRCIAADREQDVARCSFTVTILDRVPPQLTCPNLLFSTDPGQCSKSNATWVVQVSDNCPLAVTNVVCVPPSGMNLFPAGVHPVTCTTADESGNTNSCGFTVTVNDTEAPRLSYPALVETNATPGVCQQVVSYTVSASDNCGVANTVCTPPSGSTFPVGLTPVSCTATDASGNRNGCSFLVAVNGIPNCGPGSCPASYPLTLLPGRNFIANQLDQGSNTLAEVFPRVPDGATLWKFDSCQRAWGLAATFWAGAGWDARSVTLNPGEGAFVDNPLPAAFELTFTGLRRCARPLPRCLVLGDQVVSDAWPESGTFASILGVAPEEGTLVQRWDASAGAYTLVAEFVFDEWWPEAPTARVGEPWFVSWPKTEMALPADVVTNAPSCNPMTINVGMPVPKGCTNCPPPAVVRRTAVRSDGRALAAPYSLGTTRITWSWTHLSGLTESCVQQVTLNPPGMDCGPTSCPLSYAITLAPGDNLIANPLDHGSNTLNEVLSQGVPDGAVLNKMSPGDGALISATFRIGLGWLDLNQHPSPLTLAPGEGAFLRNPLCAPVAITLTGTRRCAPHLPLCLLPGMQLASGQLFEPGVFASIVGLPPVHRTMVARLQPDGSYLTYTYVAGVGWLDRITDWGLLAGDGNVVEPMAGVGEAWVVTWPDASAAQVDWPPDLVTNALQCSATVEMGPAVFSAGCTSHPLRVVGKRSDGLAFTDPFPLGTTRVIWTATNLNLVGDAVSYTQRVTVTQASETYTITAHPGFNLIANQLDHGSNTANEILASVPEGAQLFHWDTALQTYAPDSPVFVGQGWAPNAKLAPGKGAFLFLPQGQPSYSLTFIGTRRCPRTQPCLIRGWQLLSAPWPQAGDFASIVGQPPVAGTKVVRWDPLAQAYATNEFLQGAWSPANPVAQVGEAWFLYWPLPSPVEITCLPDIVTNSAPDECEALVSVGQPSLSGGCAPGGLPGLTGLRSDGLPLTAPYPAGTTVIGWTARDSSGHVVSCAQRVTVNRTTASHTVQLVPGWNFIANPFDKGGNTLDQVLPEVPDNTILFKFDTCQQGFLGAATFLRGEGWEPASITLSPGEGAFLQVSEPSTVTLTGLRRCARQLPLCPIQGYQVVSDQLPEAGSFATVVGLDAAQGTVVYTWNPAEQTWSANVFTEGDWSGGQPAARVGEPWWVDWPLPSPSSIQMVCPADRVASAAPGQCSAVVEVAPPTATGGCLCAAPRNGPPVVTGTRSDGKSLADPYPVGTTWIAWTATNASGGFASCSQRIAVSCSGASCPASYAITVWPGVLNLIANHLDQGGNTVGEVLPLPNNVDEAELFKFDADTQDYTLAATFLADFGWLPPSATLEPGQGAYLRIAGPAPVDLVFTGLRRCEHRLPLCPVQGYQVVSDQLPEPGDFASIVGLAPVPGTQVLRQTPGGFVTNTYDGAAWSPAPPTARVGEAWFLFWPVQDALRMVCPANIVVEATGGQCSARVSVAEPVVTGGCSSRGGPTVAGARSDGATLSDPYPVGTTPITWTATEASGHTVTCTQQVTVNRTVESYRLALVPGWNFIANPLENGGNTLEEVLPEVPDGTTLAKFDTCQQQNLMATYATGLGWTDSMTLEPGEGALLQLPTSQPYFLTLTGVRRCARQWPLCPVQGLQWVSEQLPQEGDFASIVGLAPPAGTKVYRWVPDLQAYVTNRFDGSIWSAGPPSARVGEAWILDWPSTIGLQLTCGPAVEVDTTGGCGAVVTLTPPTPSGACGCAGSSAATVTGVRSDGLSLAEPYPFGATMITWTARDQAGQTASCLQRVVVKCGACNYTVTVRANQFTPIANQCRNLGTIAALMPSVPVGTRLWKWNPEAAAFDPVNVFSTGWSSPRQTLSPGDGAFILSPSDLSVTLTGACNTPVLPSPYRSCCNVLASRQMACPGNYTNILGVPPTDGAYVFQWNTALQMWDVFTYLFDLQWVPSEPTAAVGDWLFFKPDPNGACVVPSFQSLCVSRREIPPGYSLIANQCSNANTMASLLPNPPDQTLCWKYHNEPGNGHFEIVNAFSTFAGAWSNPGQPLRPGEGALLYNPGGAFPMVVAGGENTPTLPLAFAASNGWYLVSRQTNAPGTWADITGRPVPIVPGAKMVKILPSGSADPSQTAVWTGAEWSPAAVITAVGEAVWISPRTPPAGEPTPPRPVACGYTWHLQPGLNLIANQCLNASTLTALLPQMAEGSLLLKYDNTNGVYEPVNFTFNAWNRPHQTLRPGEGAWLFNAGGAREVAVYGAPNTPHYPLPGVSLTGSGPYLVSAQTSSAADWPALVGSQPPGTATMYRYDATNRTVRPTTTALVGEAVWIYPQGGGPPTVPDLTNYVYRKTIFPGNNLIANQLSNDNTVATLFPSAPFGTYLVKHSPVGNNYEPVNTFTVGGWTHPDQNLSPGEGAWLVNPSSRQFEVRISGTPIPSPSVPPAGVNPQAPCGLVSFPGNRPATYSDIMGPLHPPDGTTVATWDPASQTFSVFQCYAGSWEPAEPLAAVGEPLLIYGGGCYRPAPTPPCALNIFLTPCHPCYVTLSWQCSTDDCPLQVLEWTDDLRRSPLTGKIDWRPVSGNPVSPFTTLYCSNTVFYRLKCKEPPPGSQ